jgi:FixJ family two-component response regulator
LSNLQRTTAKRAEGNFVNFVRGYSETERVKEAQKLGAGKHIKKPYSTAKIGSVVKSELRQ